MKKEGTDEAREYDLRQKAASKKVTWEGLFI
jgi:hypothetical protein